VYGLLAGWPDAEIVRYASALAAMVCLTYPGVLKSPTHEQVLAFIDKQTMQTQQGQA